MDGAAHALLEGDPQGVLRIDWVSGAAMLLRAEAVGEKIFDETYFMFGEDMELCDRVRRDGWDVLYTSEHSIIHHHGRSFDQQESLAIVANAHDGPRRVFSNGRGRLSVFVYDAILLTGYLARWLVFGAAAAIRPGNGYEAKSRFSRNYVPAMLHVARE